MFGSGGSHYRFPRVTGLGHFFILLIGNFFCARIVTDGVCPSP
jgi:hypothetical protein